MEPRESAVPRPDPSRVAEFALRRLCYARVAPSQREASVEAAFWVRREGGKRTVPVFIEGTAPETRAAVRGWIERRAGGRSHREAIVVVPTDGDADEAWRRYGGEAEQFLDRDLAILVLPPGRADSNAHWHARIVPRSEILRLATGVVVGMFRRAQAAGSPTSIDFEEMLQTIRHHFGVDVHRSLGVRNDEDALYLIYQMALKDAYAPGDPAPNLHMLVLKPSGPAARLPWFAA